MSAKAFDISVPRSERHQLLYKFLRVYWRIRVTILHPVLVGSKAFPLVKRVGLPSAMD